mmetsp:Transcript_119209/g.222897  ORF Transcript_119209/g.222897 Transcript_119209/m.222897 type:complete len:91 (-) Transcript_119209:308-580(-)
MTLAIGMPTPLMLRETFMKHCSEAKTPACCPYLQEDMPSTFAEGDSKIRDRESIEMCAFVLGPPSGGKLMVNVGLNMGMKRATVFGKAWC